MLNKQSSNMHGIFRSGKYSILFDLLIMLVVGLIIIIYYTTINHLTGKDSMGYGSDAVFSMLITFILYFLFRRMFGFLNDKFPWKESIKKRLIIEVPLIIVISVGTMVVFTLFWNNLHNKSTNQVTLFMNSTIALLVSVIINLFTEGSTIFKLYKETAVSAEILKRKTLESHFETLKSQVAPHFLFNSLNTLIALIDESPKIAKDFVQHLANYYRYSMQINARETVDLETELNLVRNYIFLLTSRFGENLKIEFPQNNKEFEKHVVPLAVQLLVENAVKHNVISSSKPLTISILVGENTVAVRNNLQKKDATEISNRLGLDNIRNRYAIVCQLPIHVNETEDYFEVKLPLLDR
jgi:two-component system, LytTR family, sensor kinase